MSTMTLPDLLRGLVLQRGWSTTNAAHEAGISPAAADNWLSGLTPAALTWLRLVTSFQAEVRIARGAETWTIRVPPVPAPVRERERKTWRQRRFIDYLHSIAAQNRTLKRAERETRARAYVANEESRIIAGIDDTRQRMTGTLLAGEVAGMRRALQDLVAASHLTVDQLSFASGVGIDAAAMAVHAGDDGRLRPLRALLAALDARLELHLPSGSRLVIARLAAEEPRVATASHARVAAKRQAKPATQAVTRSRLERDDILKLYDAGIPITQIAEQAGISRQRVHAIAKHAGRTLRRASAAEARTREAESLLS